MAANSNIECKSGPTAIVKGVALSKTPNNNGPFVSLAQAAGCPDLSHGSDNPRVNAASDERVVNNVMRHEYRVLSEEEKALMKLVKDLGLECVKVCDAIGNSRELSLAKTKAEEFVMWAVKHITR